ncbi:MAG: hypothetical protein AAB487_01990 [Patescibacteria group bacterium]
MVKKTKIIVQAIIAKSDKILRRRNKKEFSAAAAGRKPRFLRLKKIQDKIRHARDARKNKLKVKKKRQSVLEFWEQGFQGGFSQMARKPANLLKKKKEEKAGKNNQSQPLNKKK